MPVTFDNIGFSWSTGAGVSVSFPFTAAANTVLLAFTGANGDRSCSAVTYNGVNMSLLLDQATGGLQVWGLTAPAAGANTVVATWVATGAIDFGCIVASYLNVKTIGPFGTVVGTASSGAATCGLSLSSTTVDVVAYCAKVNGATMTLAPGTTRLSATVSSGVRLVIADVAGAAALSVSASTGAGSSIKIIGVPLIFSAVAATSPFSQSLLGVGY